MSRIIINNNSNNLHDEEALELVRSIILGGRVSDNGKQYCYATRFSLDGFAVIVTTMMNKKSDSFKIYDDKS